MQEQVQVYRPLSFEEICPDFSMLVREHGWDELKGKTFQTSHGERDLSNMSCCIVGEAHGG